MGSTKCIQGQAEESREPLTLGPMSEELPQDILQCFRVQENLESSIPFLLSPPQNQLIPLFSRELAPFFPMGLGGLDWSSRQRILSGHLVESLAYGFSIHLRVNLTEEEGEAFMGALRVNRIEEQPVVEMEGNMEVVDVEPNCRD